MTGSNVGKDLPSSLQNEVHMMQPEDLYLRMTRISERYAKLKVIFDNFCQLATAQLTNEKCTVKGIAFSPRLERNCFDVSFAGETVRFLFFVAENESPSLKGLVKCNAIARDEKLMDRAIGEFSFDHHADTTFMTSDGDPLGIDTESAAGYVVLHFLNNTLGKMTEPVNANNRR
jgi:hypothetical protein